MTKPILALGALTFFSAAALACSAPPDEVATADVSADEIRQNTAFCANGALASDRLQPGVKGGPDGRAHVHCDAGYSRCRIDPKGPDNDVCTDANNCYACSRPAPKLCVQNVICAISSHFDHAACTCVPNTCIQNVLCAQSGHFDHVTCKCVAN